MSRAELAVHCQRPGLFNSGASTPLLAPCRSRALPHLARRRQDQDGRSCLARFLQLSLAVKRDLASLGQAGCRKGSRWHGGRCSDRCSPKPQRLQLQSLEGPVYSPIRVPREMNSSPWRFSFSSMYHACLSTPTLCGSAAPAVPWVCLFTTCSSPLLFSILCMNFCRVCTLPLCACFI